MRVAGSRNVTSSEKKSIRAFIRQHGKAGAAEKFGRSEATIMRVARGIRKSRKRPSQPSLTYQTIKEPFVVAKETNNHDILRGYILALFDTGAVAAINSDIKRILEIE